MHTSHGYYSGLQSFWLCGYYLKVVSIRRNAVHTLPNKTYHLVYFCKCQQTRHVALRIGVHFCDVCMYVHICQSCLGLSVCHSTSFSALYINNQWTTSPWIITKGSARCYAKSPTVQDAFWPRSQTPPQPLGIRNTIYCLELTSQSKWTQCACTCCFWTVSWGSHQTVSCKFSFTFRWPRLICCHALPVSTWPVMCVAAISHWSTWLC